MKYKEIANKVQRQYRCKICGYMDWTKTAVIQHIKKEHTEEEIRSSE